MEAVDQKPVTEPTKTKPTKKANVKKPEQKPAKKTEAPKAKAKPAKPLLKKVVAKAKVSAKPKSENKPTKEPVKQDAKEPVKYLQPRNVKAEFVNTDEDYNVIVLMGSPTLVYGEARRAKGVAFGSIEQMRRVAKHLSRCADALEAVEKLKHSLKKAKSN